MYVSMYVRACLYVYVCKYVGTYVCFYLYVHSLDTFTDM